MSREAALDLQQIIGECYDAVLVMGLQRSRPFYWPTKRTVPDPHNTLVHRQSVLGRNWQARRRSVARATIASLWAALPPNVSKKTALIERQRHAPRRI